MCDCVWQYSEYSFLRTGRTKLWNWHHNTAVWKMPHDNNTCFLEFSFSFFTILKFWFYFLYYLLFIKYNSFQCSIRDNLIFFKAVDCYFYKIKNIYLFYFYFLILFFIKDKIFARWNKIKFSFHFIKLLPFIVSFSYFLIKVRNFIIIFLTLYFYWVFKMIFFYFISRKQKFLVV